MSTNSRTIQRVVWGFLAAIILSIFATYFARRVEAPNLPVYSQISGFNLTNQSGQTVTLAALRGKVWIANVIFTRCAGPCARLTREMQQVQAAFPETAQLCFVSLTADPAFDTPEVLRQYGNRFQADPGRWFFVTGNKSDVCSLATKELKFTVIENEQDGQPGEDLFIHSQKFVVADRGGRIRAYIDGDEPQTVPQLTRAVEALLNEKEQ
jgi:protein SCO1/2